MMAVFTSRLRKSFAEPAVRRLVGGAFWWATGLLVSAASLKNVPLPLAAALAAGLSPGPAALVALGGSAGYLLFWGGPGLGGMLWCAMALGLSLLGSLPAVRCSPWLLPSLASLGVAAAGLGMQQRGWAPPPGLYLLQVGLAALATRLVLRTREGRDALTDWLLAAGAVLALAQVTPLPWLGLGFFAGGALTVAGAFPAAGLAGLALDLADVTAVPMAAVLCLAWLFRFLGRPRLAALAPGLCYPAIMALTGRWDLMPLPGLLLGGLAGQFLPGSRGHVPRRGEVGVAQVRLELAGASLDRLRCALLEAIPPPLDDSLPPERLRQLRSLRRRQEEYRTALVQQYAFLSTWLRELADGLPRSIRESPPRLQPRVSFRANRPRAENGDRCLSFSVAGCRHYVAILDGMGTGPGAVDEGTTAALLLRQLLEAGFSASSALENLASLQALRDRAGFVTVDLAELRLDTGRCTLYKWGAPPGWLLDDSGWRQVGAGGPPPGLQVGEHPQPPQAVLLGKGRTLLLLSDGACPRPMPQVHPEDATEEIADAILSAIPFGPDDATVAVVRLEAVL